jgi:Cof subfamily protein (haloacid dehalogenase superfamily)
MVKAIILDVDGVIVGDKVGYNAPYPNPLVFHRLRSIRKKGIPIILCTGKPHYSINYIINEAQLDNIHVTQGGAVIIDTMKNKIIQKHTIDKILTHQLTQMYLLHNVYIEIYTLEQYFIQKNQLSTTTQVHSLILQKEPQLVDEFDICIKNNDIVKIMPIAQDEADKEKITSLFRPFQNTLTLSWGVHPVANPLQFGIITAVGISKRQTVEEITRSTGVDRTHMLGVGDSLSDWQFIELCGYKAAMGNATNTLKDLVLKTKQNEYITGSVDENGILAIFDHFHL